MPAPALDFGRVDLIVLVVLAVTQPFGARPAQAQEDQDSQVRQELQRLLRQRDDVILELQRRVEQLEQRLNAAPPPPAAAQQPAPATAPRTVAEPAPSPEAVPPRTAPGAVVADEATAERALERSLVTTGVLLLPPGTAEISPSFSYARAESDEPVLVVQGGAATGALSRNFRRNEFQAGLDVSVGLPLDAQLELALPYDYVDRSTAVGTGEGSETDDHGGGLGDLAVGLAKTLAREKGLWPDLVGRVTWDTATGESRDNGVALDGGSHELIFDLTASRSLDPLVVAGTVFYRRSFEDGDVRLGDRTGYSLNAFLAASPETSLRFGFSQTFADDNEFDGGNVEGTDFSAASFDLGASVVLGSRTLLDVSGSIGATEAASDYTLRVALPIRFDLPVNFF